jgi:bacteriorhodopsin
MYFDLVHPSNKSFIQQRTFLLSLVVQVVVLIFSVVSFVLKDPPRVLRIVLLLETVVQGVEFLWYAMIGIYYYVKKSKTNSYQSKLRYYDWAITTPTMLISLFLLIFWYNDECGSVDAMTNSPAFALCIVSIVICDWAMLCVGFNANVSQSSESNKSSSHRTYMMLGFLFLVLAFFPHLHTLSVRYSETALVLIVFTLVTWCFYGLVEWWIVSTGDDNDSIENKKNSCYNILDIVSKNITGLIVAFAAFYYDGDKCSSIATSS